MTARNGNYVGLVPAIVVVEVPFVGNSILHDGIPFVGNSIADAMYVEL